MRSWILFGLAAIFATLFLVVVGNYFHLPNPAMILLAAAFFLLGLVLVIVAARGDDTGKLRYFLILTGTCAAAMPITAVLHNFGFHAFLFILALLILPAIFLVALATSAILLAMSQNPPSGRTRILLGGVLALILVSVGCVVDVLDGRSGYEVTSQLVGPAPEELDRVFVTVEADKALMDVVYHSFEHSLVAAFEANGIATGVQLMPDDAEAVASLAEERTRISPNANLHIRLQPLYRTHRRGFEAIVGTVFEASLASAESGQELWQLSGNVDYVADRFFDNPEFTTGHGMKKEFAWHTTAAIVRTFMVDVIGRESEPIYTVTEERERKGQRVD